jgi:hypothetical protein
MQLVKITKRVATAVLTAVFLTASASPAALARPHPTDKYGEGEGWVIHAHYYPKQDRTLCELIIYPTPLPGNKAKHRHVEDSEWAKGRKDAFKCARITPLKRSSWK